MAGLTPSTLLAPATEQFQHFLSDLRESFWGDLNGRTRETWKKFFEADSERQRDRFAVVDAYERNDKRRRDYRNGYYERDFVTVLGTLRLRIARKPCAERR
jgi:transposase-like protein